MGTQDAFQNSYKSGGEKKIARYLTSQHIDFTYERPVAVLDQGKTKIWYPDFFMDGFHIILEYLGMNRSSRGAEINDYKRKVYSSNKMDLIEIYPEDFGGNWKGIIQRGICETLESRVQNYFSRFDSYNPK